MGLFYVNASSSSFQRLTKRHRFSLGVWLSFICKKAFSLLETFQEIFRRFLQMLCTAHFNTGMFSMTVNILRNNYWYWPKSFRFFVTLPWKIRKKTTYEEQLHQNKKSTKHVESMRCKGVCFLFHSVFLERQKLVIEEDDDDSDDDHEVEPFNEDRDNAYYNWTRSTVKPRWRKSNRDMRKICHRLTPSNKVIKIIWSYLRISKTSLLPTWIKQGNPCMMNGYLMVLNNWMRPSALSLS
jgi:hypothetical protein